VADSLPLPAQLSAAFVALAIEIDNTAEERIAHHTTAFRGSAARDGVWLASIAMWFNAVRVLAEVDELTVGELRERTRLDTNVDGLRRWGYATVDGIGRRLGEQLRPTPKPSSVLRLTTRGHAAHEAWAPLPAEVEQRWRDRFGSTVIDRLRAALLAAAQLEERELPGYLPILTFGLWADRQRKTKLSAGTRSAASAADDASLPLICLLARVLLAFTLDYETDARLALPVWAAGLRVLGSEPTPVRDLPARAGVGTEAMAMVLKQLERAGCVETTSIPGRRGKQVCLTQRGAAARSGGARRVASVSEHWVGRFGPAVDELRSALQPLVGDATRAGSPLFAGLEPGPANWRADVAPPDCLPWYPLVLHRGGYPDGS
jgi:DNA-binding MarR family transcriptional regulator